MSDTTIGLDQTEQILTYEVSDEALEIGRARGTKKRGATHFFSALLWICAQAPDAKALGGSGGHRLFYQPPNKRNPTNDLYGTIFKIMSCIFLAGSRATEGDVPCGSTPCQRRVAPLHWDFGRASPVVAAS